MPIPHVFEMNEIIPTSRTTDESGRHVLTGGACSAVDRMYVTAKRGVITLVMAENHIKTNSSGLQLLLL